MIDSVRDYKMRKIQRRLGRRIRDDSEIYPDDQIKWVTSNGEHIPIKKGTGEAVGPAGEDRDGELVLSNAESLPISELREKNGNTQSEREQRQYEKKAEKAYERAVAAGDALGAFKILWAFAKRRGYSLRVFHGTPKKFNAFKRKQECIHVGTLEQANDAVHGKLIDRAPKKVYKLQDLFDHMKDTPLLFRKRLVEMVQTKLKKQDPKGFKPFDKDYHKPEDVSDWVASSYSSVTGLSKDKVGSQRIEMPDYSYIKENSTVLPLLVRVNNPYVIETDLNYWGPSSVAGYLLFTAGDPDYSDWGEYYDVPEGSAIDMKLSESEIKSLQKVMVDASALNGEEEDDPANYYPMWDQVEKIFRDHGYDGIKYKNLGEGDTTGEGNYSYLVFSPRDIMRATPGLKDKDGDLIPLSERFPTTGDDMRGMVGSKKNEKPDIGTSDKNKK